MSDWQTQDCCHTLSLSSFSSIVFIISFNLRMSFDLLCDIEDKKNTCSMCHSHTNTQNSILYNCCCSTAAAQGHCHIFFLSLFLPLHLIPPFSSRFLPFLWLMSQQKVTLWSVNRETPKLTNWSTRDSLVWHMGRLVRHMLTHKGKSVYAKNKKAVFPHHICSTVKF